MWLAYCIFDKKTAGYMKPTFVKSPVEVNRNLEILVKDKNSSLCLFPADFAIYKVGSFDDHEGKFVHQEKPEFYAEVVDFLPKQGAVQNG